MMNCGKEKSEKLKELLGHTPFEVLVGCILGIGVGLIFTDYLTTYTTFADGFVQHLR